MQLVRLLKRKIIDMHHVLKKNLIQKMRDKVLRIHFLMTIFDK
jgi:hypothetical protein